MFHEYANPKKVGWLGWFECGGRATAFVGLDGRVSLFDDQTKAITPLGRRRGRK